MDNRTGRRSREPERYVSEVGTDTVPVNLVEIQSVGGGTRSPRRVFVAGIAIVGIVAFALGASLATTKPEPSPTAPAVAVASATPRGATSLPPSASPTARPASTPLVTPLVTPPPSPPPWAWTRTDLPTDGLIPQGIWALDGALAVVMHGFNDAAHGEQWEVARYGDGDWSIEPLSRAVTWLYGGTMVDGRLWFLASVAGASEEDVTWQLVSTADGQSWDALPPVRGLDELNGFEFLARVDGTWVAAARQHGVCCDAGGQTVELVWSLDGVHWEAAEVPALEEVVSYQAAVRDGAILVVGDNLGDQQGRWVVLSSASGRSWRREDVPGLPQTFFVEVTGIACNDDTCLMITTDRSSYVWTEAKGWRAFDIAVPDSPLDNTVLRPLTATGDGFVTVVGESGIALVSRGGVRWEARDVMPLGLSKPVIGMAITGDVITVITETFDSTPNGVWRGSLAALGL